MAEADRLAIAAGTPEAILMDRAGSAVAVEAERLLGDNRGMVLVLCGTGNNGGDGFVAARRLRARGIGVTLAVLGAPDALKGEAAAAARGWRDAMHDATMVPLGGVALIVDALFGAGLNRRLEGDAADLVTRVNASGVPVLAVDIPSGIDGNTGAAGGPAIRANTTITFFRYQARPSAAARPRACRHVRVLADIGIDPAVLGDHRPRRHGQRPRALGERLFPGRRSAGTNIRGGTRWSSRAAPRPAAPRG